MSATDNIKKFVDGTKDSIERVYGPTVLKNFPNYAEFWAKYIGDPKKSEAEPYGLIFPSNEKNSEQQTLFYQELCMAHYSLFCHLAGAHFQLKQLEEILQMNDSNDKVFRHWETFEVCYFHLGSTYYQLHHLWGLVFLFKGEVTRNGKWYNPNITDKLKDYYKTKQKDDFWKEVSELHKGIKDIRDNIVHFSRLRSAYFDGEFLILLHIEQKVWEKQMQDGKTLETSRKAKSDLNKTEQALNNLHTDLIQELGNYLKSKKIIVNY